MVLGSVLLPSCYMLLLKACNYRKNNYVSNKIIFYLTTQSDRTNMPFCFYINTMNLSYFYIYTIFFSKLPSCFQVISIPLPLYIFCTNMKYIDQVYSVLVTCYIMEMKWQYKYVWWYLFLLHSIIGSTFSILLPHRSMLFPKCNIGYKLNKDCNVK